MAAETVGIFASLAAPALELGKCFKKQFNYLCRLKTNIQVLSDAVREVEDARDGLRRRVDGARRNGEDILPAVETWLQRAEETEAIRLQIIEPPIPGILNLKRRYTRSRNAKRRAESMGNLRATCNFNLVSTPPLPAALVPIARPGGALEFASRKQTEEDIIEAMSGEEVKVIGVCGMGGVGKTMMAKQIMNRVGREKEGLFDEVVMVAVGQQGDLLKIQRDIADWLGMKFEEETLVPRANRLRARLMGGKRMLIVIDDIWERIDLEDLGIPCGSCSILLTSRDRCVLDQTDAHKIFTVKKLSEEEAWFMFKENAGASVNDSNLLPIAIEIVKKCDGLPLALIAVARALKGNLSEPIWKDALKQLRIGNPVDMPLVIKEVYNPIRLSYDFLENKNARSLLFLCSFFPEDYDISLQEELLYYGFGLCMFDEISNLEEARYRIATLIDMLKSRFMILDGRDEHHVKMHDVVRDVVIFIASMEKHAILQFSSMECFSRRNSHSDDCTMLSVVPNERMNELTMEMSFPTLQFLWMDGTRFEEFQSSDHFFKGMQQLKVLYMKSFSFASTPQAIQLLKNLHTLHLHACGSMETLSVVGELSCLEILICHRCYKIMELPVEIGRLNRLMLLDVSGCCNLKKIMPGVISNLVRLEELKMLDSFKGWESDEKGNHKSNASLSELESLCNLKCLEIEIEDWSLAAQELKLSSKIVKYTIVVGEISDEVYWRFDGRDVFHSSSYGKKVSLNFPTENLVSLGNWIHDFARDAETLSLEGGASQCFDFASNTQNKKCLAIAGCSVVKNFSVLPVLEALFLVSLPNLDEIFYGHIQEGLANSLAKLNKLELINLRNLHISKCGMLRNLFSSSVLMSLSHLQIETLEIEDCESMEEVFSMELEEKDYGKSACITFPKLENLLLDNLQRLTTFCKGNHGTINVELPQLADLKIEYCPKLISFNNIGADQNHINSSSSAAAHHRSVHLLCNTELQDVTFGSLNYLTIGGYKNDISYLWCHHIPHSFFAGLVRLEINRCANIHILFSYSIAKNLVNLKRLEIVECNEMVYVIADDINTVTSATNPQIIFHKLGELRLEYLPMLQSFSKGQCDLQFPSLTKLHICACPVMGYLSTEVSCSADHDYVHRLFCNAKIIFSRLKDLHIERCNKESNYLWCHNIPHSFFAGLVELRVYGCANINNLFSYSVAGNLVNLKELRIEKCNEMIYVIADDVNTETSETNPQMIFRKLEELQLYSLPKLQFFCKGKRELQFPSLKQVNIVGCSVMRSITLEDYCSSHQDYVHIFPNTKITFQSLNGIWIGGYEKDIRYLWCHHIPPPFFAGLVRLTIQECANIKNLFSYSIAGNLVNLERLWISGCNEMVYGIADDISVETSSTNPQIIFHKLKFLSLKSLPKFRSFCDGKRDLQLSSLKDVEIYKCPMMEGFEMGLLRISRWTFKTKMSKT